MKNKRMFFSCWSIFIISLTFIINKYPAEIYQYVVVAIIGGFLGFQSLTDYKKKDGE